MYAGCHNTTKTKFNEKETNFGKFCFVGSYLCISVNNVIRCNILPKKQHKKLQILYETLICVTENHFDSIKLFKIVASFSCI